MDANTCTAGGSAGTILRTTNVARPGDQSSAELMTSFQMFLHRCHTGTAVGGGGWPWFPEGMTRPITDGGRDLDCSVQRHEDILRAQPSRTPIPERLWEAWEPCTPLTAGRRGRNSMSRAEGRASSSPTPIRGLPREAGAPFCARRTAGRPGCPSPAAGPSIWRGRPSRTKHRHGIGGEDGEAPDSTILRTTDGGTTWTRQYVNMFPGT